MQELLVRVRTSNIKKAGTDSKISLTIIGQRKRTKRRLDDKEND